MFVHETTYRVPYADTDRMGYMYYGNYARLYEIGRVEALRSLGIRYKDMEDNMNTLLPVVHLECKYIRPLKYDDLAIIKSTVKTMPTTDIIFEHEVYNEDKELLNIGRIRLKFIDGSKFKVVEIPEEVAKVMQPYFEETNT